MARIKYGGIITDISGSVGGSTFQKSLYGNTLRNKPNSHKSATAPQLLVRSYMMQLHAAWSGLTNDQRLQWNRFINFSGQTIKKDTGVTMTGHDLFIKYNMLRMISGFAVMSVPTYSLINSFPSSLSIKNDLSAPVLILSTEINSNLLWFVFKVSSQRNPSLSFSFLGLRHMKIMPTSTDRWNFLTQWFSVFGSYVNTGDVLHYSIIFFSVVSPVYTSIQTGKLTLTIN